MTTSTQLTLVWIAGILHFCQLPGMLLFWYRVLSLRDELARLSPVTRRIVHVLAAAVVLTVLGTGGVVLVGRQEVARGTPLALALCTFLCVFWGLRAIWQVWYGPVWPKTLAGRFTHFALLLLFLTQSALYGWLLRLPAGAP
jgi:hypothetical protein